MTVSMNPSTEREKVSQVSVTDWDNAISEADKEIQRLMKQVRRLQHAKGVFIKNKKDGIIWPEISSQMPK